MSKNVAVKHDFECKRDNYHFKGIQVNQKSKLGCTMNTFRGATRLLTRFPSSMMTVDIIMPQVIPQFSFSPETKHHGAQNQLGSRTWCACKCSLESF
ncbi:uncharacterized protein LOC131062854 isoform X2 [Cryptomeria japonica]|uniref:uncharacterized protein LOC131062854 isoform X2 n=1 Tax=Cryptomeria japonica TaxID=3369 RepID=UPI0027D9E971|nr:uncharacterized protein LOC131062854 isoform X2 [Cryptomeria japonica]